MTPKQPLDFTKVEALRKHMLLTTNDICTLFGVSRMTYYGWVKGKPIRTSNDVKVRAVLKRLLSVMTDHQWPSPEVLGLEQKLRVQRLKDLLENYI